MGETIHVLAFAGSLRSRSHNRGLIRTAAELAPPYVEIETFDLTPIPLYNADLTPTPEAVVEFRQKIKAADALLIATPEYNYSVSGVLKNAIDWASRAISRDEPAALQGKPAAILGAGGRFGTVRAQAHLRYILLHNDVKVVNKPEVMVVRSWEHFDQEGNLTDETTRQQVAELVEALYQWVIQLRK
ncbi:MAG TPA: NAD(P)H-dependent oxidoreductase [Caldilineaceae bacterium]|nr:NAD(P)H-dependent oxidoreductase [Caldilineaceae bacterium]